jgi:hypothetical protein
MRQPPPRTEAELLELLRSDDVRAPEALHRRIESLVAERTASGRRGVAGRLAGGGRESLALRLGGAVAALAATTALLVAVLSGGGPTSGGGSALSLHEATALTLSGATASAPAESPSNNTELTAAVQGVHFPYWKGRFGWRSTGQRVDLLGGRSVTTVFYADQRGERIGYAIVAGTPPPRVSGGVVTWRSGTPYRVVSDRGAWVVTWLREGRLCVLSGRSVDDATLLRLASSESLGTSGTSS